MTGEENDPAADEAPTTDRPVDVEITSTHDADAIEAAVEAAAHPADHSDVTSPGMRVLDAESTVDLTGDDLDAVAAAAEHDSGAPAEPAPAEDDSGLPAEAAAEHDPRSPEDAAPSLEAEADSDEDAIDTTADVSRGHLKGLLEALIFASDKPIKANELAKSATAQTKQVKELLEELKVEFSTRGVQLDEVAGGWIFRTNAQFAPFVRDLTKQKPVKLTRAQIETLSILAYRQPITRPEIDEIRGVDSGPVLKLLLERDLVRILGKKDEPGRPILYGTTPDFLEFFGLKSLKDLPTLREFSDLTEESRRVVERELGETLEGTAGAVIAGESTAPTPHAGDTLPPSAMLDGDEAMSSVTDAPPPMPALEELEEVRESDDARPDTHATDGPPSADEADDADESADSEESLDADDAARARKPGDTDEPAAPDAPALNADDEAEFPDDDDSEFDDDDDDDDDNDDDDEEEEEDADE